jgi:hypothetical protein
MWDDVLDTKGNDKLRDVQNAQYYDLMEQVMVIV